MTSHAQDLILSQLKSLCLPAKVALGRLAASRAAAAVRRRDLRILSQMNDRALSDMGISRRPLGTGYSFRRD